MITIALSDLESRLATATATVTASDTSAADTSAGAASASASTASAGAGRGVSFEAGLFAGSGLFPAAGPVPEGGLFHGPDAGVLDSGLAFSAETVRRLACDCQVIPMVLGSHGEPLNVGRASREATPAIRRALDVRDRGCAFPGCDRLPRWAVVHHIWHWADGGPTSCGNCVLLCGHHHRVVHHHGWDVHIAADGLPSFYPPAWIDPDRKPRRNHRHQPHPATRDGNGSTSPGAGPPGAGPPGAGPPGDRIAPVVPFTRRN